MTASTTPQYEQLSGLSWWILWQFFWWRQRQPLLACPSFLPASQGPLPLERSSRVLPCPSFPTGQSRLLSLRISNCTTTTFWEICAPNDELRSEEHTSELQSLRHL